MAEKDFVKLKNVTKIYQMGEVQIRAVDGIDFSIDKGEFVVVVGPSGAGKTTVLNILGGMDKGRILAILKPHIFFDDQVDPHLTSASHYTPSVYIPINGGRAD